MGIRNKKIPQISGSQPLPCIRIPWKALKYFVGFFTPFLIQHVGVMPWEYAFLSSSQVTLMLQVKRVQFDNHCLQRQTEPIPVLTLHRSVQQATLVAVRYRASLQAYVHTYAFQFNGNNSILSNFLEKKSELFICFHGPKESLEIHRNSWQIL